MVLKSEKTLIIISYYDRRPGHNLLALIDSISRHPAGGEFDMCVVVNRTKEESLRLPAEYSWISVDYRHNVGMNIGAWDHGWRTHQGYKAYLFLQDECYVIRDNWLAAYSTLLENSEIGMIGETLNLLWDKPWPKLRELFAKHPLPEHTIGGEAVNRVDFYLNFFHEHQVDPGQSGKHLRSVIWYLSGTFLRKIDGFLIGRNYGECIAAEIAASKRVEALGRGIAQVCNDEEFFYIRHLEYNQDQPGSRYSHNVKYVDYASVQRLLEAKESEIQRLKKRRFGLFRTRDVR
jgi:hypothetical protein